MRQISDQAVMTMLGLSGLSARRSVTIVDHSLKDENGHHLNVAQALYGSLKSDNYRPRLMTNRVFCAERYPEFNALPVFNATAYELLLKAMEHPNRLMALRTMFGVELAHHLRGQSADAYVFPTVLHMEMHEIARWILKHPEPQSLEIYFWAVFGPRFYASNKAQAALADTLYRHAFTLLDRAAEAGAHIQPFVETQQLAELFQPMTQLPIRVLRLPSMVQSTGLKGRAKKSESDAVVVGYGGHVVPGKGFELLPDIIERCVRDIPNLRFDIQAAIVESYDGEPIISALASMGETVRLKTSPKPPAEFQKFISQCDLILLPYSPEIYAGRGSSMCCEAEVLGVPQVVPGTASFAQQVLSNGSAVGYERYTAGDIAQALKRAVGMLGQLKKNAVAGSGQAEDQNRVFLELVSKKRRA